MKRIVFAILWGLVLFGATSVVSSLFIPIGYNSVPGQPTQGGMLFTTSICSGPISTGPQCVKVWPLEIAKWTVLLAFIISMYFIRKRSLKLTLFLLLMIVFGVGSRMFNDRLQLSGYFTQYYTIKF